MGGAASAAALGSSKKTQACPARVKVRLRWRLVSTDVCSVEELSFAASRVSEVFAQAESHVPLRPPPSPPDGEESKNIVAEEEQQEDKKKQKKKNKPQQKSSVPEEGQELELWCRGFCLSVASLCVKTNAPLLETVNSSWSFGGLTIWGCRAGDRAQWIGGLSDLYAIASENALRTLWWQAVSEGDATACQNIIKTATQFAGRPSPLLEWRNASGQTALLRAVDNSDEKLARWLVNVSADVNAKTEAKKCARAGDGPLDYCIFAESERKDIGQWLFSECGAQVLRWANLSPVSRCFRAAAMEHPWLVEGTLQREGMQGSLAEVVLQPSQWTLLHEAAAIGNEGLAKRALTQAPVLAAAGDVYGRVPLHWAACNGHKGLLELLVLKEVDIPDALGRTPLLLAAWEGQPNSCRWLAEHRANPLWKDNQGICPLWAAARALQYGSECLSSLWGDDKLEQPILLETTCDCQGSTMLHAAAAVGIASTASWILDHCEVGAIPLLLAARTNGQTALHICCIEGHIEVAELLLSWGAKDCWDDRGSAARAWADMLGLEEIVKLLRAHTDEEEEVVQTVLMSAYAKSAAIVTRRQRNPKALLHTPVAQL